MSEREKPRMDIPKLTAVFIRSAILTAARFLIMSWYVYFGVHFAEKLEPGSGYMYLIMFPLSIFGLWQLIEFLARITGLADKPRKPSESDG